MKKLFFTFAMMMIVSLANAQFEPGEWSMQVRVGLGAAKLSNMDKIPTMSSSVESKPIPSFQYGLNVEYQLASMVGLSLGVESTVQGGGWDNFNEDGVKYTDPRIELKYIGVPVVAKIYLTKGLSLNTGVRFGFLTNADVKLRTEGKISNYKTTMDTSIDIKSACEKFDLSIPVGISYEFKSHFVLGACYNIGLKKVNKESFAGEKDNKNELFILTCGYKFKL